MSLHILLQTTNFELCFFFFVSSNKFAFFRKATETVYPKLEKCKKLKLNGKNKLRSPRRGVARSKIRGCYRWRCPCRATVGGIITWWRLSNGTCRRRATRGKGRYPGVFLCVQLGCVMGGTAVQWSCFHRFTTAATQPTLPPYL